MMLHIKYQDSRSYGFRQRFFHVFHYISQCKTCDPRGGAIWSQGHDLNKLGRGPPGDAKTLGHMVSDKKIFHVFTV